MTGMGTPGIRHKETSTILDSHIMPASGGKHFNPGIQRPSRVDSAKQVIVAAEVTNNQQSGTSRAMMEIVKSNTVSWPCQMSADAGYFSSDAVSNNLTAIWGWMLHAAR